MKEARLPTVLHNRGGEWLYMLSLARGFVCDIGPLQRFLAF